MIKKVYSLVEKEKYVEEFKNSGLSMRAFVMNIGLPLSTFHNWIKKSDVGRFGKINLKDQDNTRVTPSTYDPIIIMNKNIRIEVKSEFNEDLLINIIKVMGYAN